MIKILVLSFLVLRSGYLAAALDNFPPISGTPAELQAFKDKVIADRPWTAASGVAASMTNLLGAEQRFLPGLFEMPEYKHQFKERDGFMTIHVEKMIEAKEKVSVLAPDLLMRLKQETMETLKRLDVASGETLNQALDDKVAMNLSQLIKADPKGILVGMINCLPPQERGPMFRIASLRQLSEALAHTASLTDQSLQQNFRGAPHGIDAAQVSRDFLLDFVTRQIEREEQLVHLLRARWFLRSVSIAEQSEVDVSVQAAPSSAFDINQSTSAEAEIFFQRLLALANSQSKEATHRVENYLEKVEKNWREAENTQEERVVMKPVPFFTIQEVPGYLAVHRSALTGDCGTRDDFPFPYSPLERNFFVFTDQKEAIGYVGITYINTNDELTLYVHDVQGRKMPQDIRDIAMNAIYRVLPEFGVKKMSLGTQYAGYSHARGATLQNQYLDVAIRAYFSKHSANPHGDPPQYNVNSSLFVPHAPSLAKLNVRVDRDGVEAVAKKAETPAEMLLRFLDLHAGNLEAKVQVSAWSFAPENAEQILAMLNNLDHVAVEQYYARLQALFKKYGVNLSENFIKKHEQYFVIGQLHAQDATTSNNESYIDRTISYIVASIKREEHRAMVMGLIAKHREFFSKAPEFREFLENIPLNVPVYLNRIHDLIEAGVDPLLIATTDERLLQLTQAPDPHLQTWAINEWITRKNSKDVDPAMLLALALALNNEKHATDETSLLAAKILSEIPTKDPVVIKSLSKSVAYEENVEIAFLAFSGLVRDGVDDNELKRLILKNKGREQLQKRLKNSGRLPVTILFDAPACEGAMQAAPQ